MSNYWGFDFFLKAWWLFSSVTLLMGILNTFVWTALL